MRNTRTRTHVHVHTYTYTRTRAHARVHTHVHTYIRTYTHMRESKNMTTAAAAATQVVPGALYSYSSAAALIGISRPRIYQLQAAGRFPPADRLLVEGANVKPLWEGETLIAWVESR